MLTLDDAVVANGTFSLAANFSIPEGSILAVIGPSGAGKSTLISGIAGFCAVTKGCITWAGNDITALSPGHRPISMLFQDNNLFPHLTVAQNIGLGMRPDLKLDGVQHRRGAEALVRVGLEGLAERKPGALSGGQQSRAALARVLVQNEPLILLDEPFAALGPALRVEMLNLVAALAKESGATVLMVSHAPSDARQIADQIILVADGVAHPPVATAELLDNPPAALRDYLG
ncbi:MAG: ATP-binding cassette domain-containing protein [Paracoccaceae bacterium]